MFVQFYRENPDAPLSLSASQTNLNFNDTYSGSTRQLNILVSATAITGGWRTVETINLSDNSNEFNFSPSSFILSKSASQTVSVVFAPNSSGIKTGSLIISSSGGSILTASLNGKGLVPLTLTSNVSSINFGNGYISETATRIITASAVGDSSIVETITLSDNSTQFSYIPSSFTLSGGQSRIFTASFTPTSTGTTYGRITLSSSGGRSRIVSLTGSGIFRPLILTSSVDSINFSSGYVGETSSLPIYISATGLSQSGQSELVTVTDNSTEFSYVPSSFFLFATGTGSLTTVDFVPTSSGIKTGSITFTAAGGSIKTIPLTGSAIYRPLVITSSVNNINFGEVKILQNSSSLITISAGRSTPGIDSTETVTVTSGSEDFYVSPTSSNIVSSIYGQGFGGAGFFVYFNPKSIGLKTDTITFSSSGGSIKTIGITGSSVYNNISNLNVSTNSLVFNINNGQTASQTFDIFVPGTVSGTIYLTKYSDNENRFSFSPASFGIVGSNITKSATVNFDYTYFAPASVNGSYIKVSSLNFSGRTIYLTGNVANVPLDLTTDINTLDFGIVEIGDTVNRIIQLTSSGPNNTSIGYNPSEIVTILSNSSDITSSTEQFEMWSAYQTNIISNTIAITASYTPSNIGNFNSVLTISSSGGDIVNIPITGSAVLPQNFGATGTWIQKVILTGSAAKDVGDNFGTSIASNHSGTRIVVSAPLDEAEGNLSSSGIAYVLSSGSNGWYQEAILTGSASNSSLGVSVAITALGNKIIVGAPYNNDGAYINAGKTYVFASSSNGWKEESSISLPSSLSSNSYFGFGVAVNDIGNRIIASRLFGGTGNTDGGTYVFNSGSTGWSAMTTLGNIVLNSSPYNYESGFSYDGRVLAMNSSGNIFVAGAPYGTTNYPTIIQQGLATIFESFADSQGAITWLPTTLVSDNQQSYDRFGSSVDINSAGDRVVVGAVLDEVGVTDLQNGTGVVYLYERQALNSWSITKIMTGTLARNKGDSYGHSVSINSAGDRIAVGALNDEYSALSQGLVYIYASSSINGWQLEDVISGSLPSTINSFGFKTDFNSTGNRLFIGGPGAEISSSITSSGVAYVFDKN